MFWKENIPREIGFLRGLFMLKHSWNGLHGEIPNIIGNMSGLESLDLSFNNVSGQNIPASINLLDFFSVVNLSPNNLSGRFHQVCFGRKEQFSQFYQNHSRVKKERA
jgi:Leucine-rich repeat (LRR) protein